MLTKQLTLITVFLWISTFANATEFHTFKDTQGREMEAKITRVSGEDVYIERRDGLNTHVKTSIFSEEDQAYIKKWEKDALLKNGIFEVRFSTKNTEKQEFDGGSLITEEYKVHYNIMVKNTSAEAFKDVRVEYLILKFEDALAAQKRSEGKWKRLKGEASISSIKARTEESTQTKEITMRETKLAANFVWVGGGKRSSKDKLKGIWVKVYVGDTLAYEKSKPDNMMRKEIW